MGVISAVCLVRANLDVIFTAQPGMVWLHANIPHTDIDWKQRHGAFIGNDRRGSVRTVDCSN